MSGLFITMEGTDGSGKTTQVELLQKYFKLKKYDVVFIREPGGTNIGEQLREIILNSNNKNMNNLTEAFLYASARAQLVNEVIVPSLKNGSIVLCDRYIDSSIAYQGYGRKLGSDLINKINNIATGGLVPDITIFLDLSPEVSLKRREEQNKLLEEKLDRLEQEKEYFHNQVYTGYKMLASQNKDRIKVIDATKSKEKVHEEVVKTIESIFTR